MEQDTVTQLLTVGDAALIVGLSGDAIRDAVLSGRLRMAATTPNGIRLFTPDEVQRFKRDRARRRR